MNRLLILALLVLFSCSNEPSNSNKVLVSSETVKASIYYYDSLYKDTVLIQTELLKEESERILNGVIVPVTTLTNDYINIIYSTDKIDYINYKNKVSVSYRSSSNTFITTEGTLTSDIIIGTNNYSSLSIFIK